MLGYKEPGNFIDAAHHAAFLWDVESEIFRNKNAPFVKNFLNNYENGDIPFYALVEILSFGTLSKLYKNMKNPRHYILFSLKYLSKLAISLSVSVY